MAWPDADRRFEALVLDWDRPLVVVAARPRLEALLAAGVHVTLVTGSDGAEVAAEVDLGPAGGSGRGLLHICAQRGQEVFEVAAAGPMLVWKADGAPAAGTSVEALQWVADRLGELGIGPGLVAGVDGDADEVAALLDDQLDRRLRGRVPAIDHDPRWVIEVVDDPARRRVNESITTLANGILGIRGGREEDGDGSQPLLVVRGVYTGRPVPRLLPGPIWPVLMVRGNSGPDRWYLDLRTAVLLRERADGVPLRTFRLVSLADPSTMAFRAEGGASRLAGGEALRAPGVDIAFDHHREGDTEIAVSRSDRNGGIAVATATTERLADGRRHIERIAAVAADNERPPDTYEARRRLDRSRERGFDRLLADHRAAWAERWRVASVSIDGDPEAELGVRFALFHVLASAADGGETGIGARGLSGAAYAGHVFWDSDIFVLPVLAAVNPPAARAMLEYRVHRLPAAARLASALGKAGARFPWESADDGSDVTPAFARGRDGSVIPIRTGQREEHINADIAWAACEYAAWSGDDAFLRSEGRDLVLETARYWASRIRVDRTGAGHIYGVIGPDEYHEVVDDNAYTNVMVRWHLRRAAALAESVGGAGGDEVARWRDLAEALVDGYCVTSRVYEQFAGYGRLDPLLVSEFADPPVAADMLLGPERTRRTQVIKQADVLMLHHLVPEETAPDSLTPNLDFYGPRTAHGSSLSPPLQAAVLARAGRLDEALALFRIACRLDLDDLTDTSAGGLHLATMGGVWQALAYGFMGLRPGAALRVDPHLPPSWRRVDLGLRFRGATVRIDAGHDDVIVTTDQPLSVLLGSASSPRSIDAGSTRLPTRDTP